MRADCAAGTASHQSAPMPFLLRAFTFGMSWLPFLILLLLMVPRFSALLDSLRDRDSLPAVTDLLDRFSRLNLRFACLPFAGLFGAILLVDSYLAGAWKKLVRFRGVYWIWFVGIIAAGIVAAILVPLVLLLPIITAPSTMR